MSDIQDSKYLTALKKLAFLASIDGPDLTINHSQLNTGEETDFIAMNDAVLSLVATLAEREAEIKRLKLERDEARREIEAIKFRCEDWPTVRKETERLKDKISNDTQLWEARHAAQVDELIHAEAQLADARKVIERLREALEEVVDPIRAVTKRLNPDERISGDDAIRLSESAAYLRGIARNALAQPVPCMGISKQDAEARVFNTLAQPAKGEAPRRARNEHFDGGMG